MNSKCQRKVDRALVNLGRSLGRGRNIRKAKVWSRAHLKWFNRWIAAMPMNEQLALAS
jgi:hypothetical protein